MYNNKRILALIPARGGSKGIPHKNIIDLCGKPLIAYSICAGLKSEFIDNVIVSTDDKEIADIAEEWGAEVPFLRPAYLATDTSRTVDVIVHAINFLKIQADLYDTLVLLQPTQPLRTAQDIDAAIEKFVQDGCQPLVSVSLVNDHPILIRTLNENKLKPLLNTTSTCRRQDMPDYYRVNGCIYINEINEINGNTSFNDNIVPFIMDKSHSVDIDDYVDLKVAEYYLKYWGL